MLRRSLLSSLAVIALLPGCMRWGEDTSEGALKDSFKEVIGFDQPASVRNTKSSFYWIRDSYIRWLYFECDDALLARLRLLQKNSKNYTWGDFGGPGRAEGNVNAPKWWKDEIIGPDLERIDIDRSTDRSTDVIQIWIDKKKHTAYANRRVLD